MPPGTPTTTTTVTRLPNGVIPLGPDGNPLQPGQTAGDGQPNPDGDAIQPVSRLGLIALPQPQYYTDGTNYYVAPNAHQTHTPFTNLYSQPHRQLIPHTYSGAHGSPTQFAVSPRYSIPSHHPYPFPVAIQH